ncbi:MAG: N-formylglutamate deformylase [Paracoccus sp. (in: a-proteobacteria)]|nr:N-formylglutamate deformylase [Paracoccus sp. (in: a-proteobacteria)]
MIPVEVAQGDSPVILDLPHTGTWLPDPVRDALNDRGRVLADTDWHIERLHDGLLPGATTVRATFHRDVIDANRGPDDASLYPGHNTTGLVPLTDFDGAPIWDSPPTKADVATRKARFHGPYHAALTAEIVRVKAKHGVAILYDCHSIRSHIPFLFGGTLPDCDIGTNSGRSCAPAIEAATQKVADATGRTHVVNGRFKGGWTTRHYGQPGQGVHAIQMELAQSTHLTAEAPLFAYDDTRAKALRVPLAEILTKLAALAAELKA